MRPASESSYRINYEIQFEPSLFVDTEKCLDYINHYIEYCIRNLPDEAPLLTGTQAGQAEGFNRLLEMSRQVGTVGILTDTQAEQQKEDFAYNLFTAAIVMKVIAQDVGSTYNVLEFANVAESKSGRIEYPLGKITSEYREKLTEVSEAIEEKLASLEQETTIQDSTDAWFDINI